MSPFLGRDFFATAVSLANESDEGSRRSATSRAYYATFHAARDLLRSRAVPVPQDGSAHVSVRRFFEVKYPQSKIAWELRRLHRMRKSADYDIPFPDSDLAIETASAIELAASILAELDTLAARTPTTT